jgi:hypothetical protein
MDDRQHGLCAGEDSHRSAWDDREDDVIPHHNSVFGSQQQPDTNHTVGNGAEVVGMTNAGDIDPMSDSLVRRNSFYSVSGPSHQPDAIQPFLSTPVPCLGFGSGSGLPQQPGLNNASDVQGIGTSCVGGVSSAATNVAAKRADDDGMLGATSGCANKAPLLVPNNNHANNSRYAGNQGVGGEGFNFTSNSPLQSSQVPVMGPRSPEHTASAMAASSVQRQHAQGATTRGMLRQQKLQFSATTSSPRASATLQMFD